MGYFGIPFRNGVPIGLGSIVGFGAPQEFSPSELFLGGTAGAWYDPSDLSTLFTTSAGTTQCAMPGQGSAVSVGLMLDKSTSVAATGYYSAFIGASTGRLELGGQSAFAFGTGDFTVETWIYGTPANGSVLWDFRPVGGLANTATLYYVSNQTRFFVNGVDQITGGALTAGVWNHVAIARSGTSTKLFINGSQSGSTYTDTTNYVVGTNRPAIGFNGSSPGAVVNTYMSNFRVVKGAAVYTGNFTPSIAPLTAISGTSLLTLQNNYFKDNSGNGFGVTPTGDVSVNLLNPFDATAARTINNAIAFNDTTARPELRARVNLLTYSEEFDNGAWSKAAGVTVTPNTDIAPDGTLTADTLNSSAGNQISVDVACAANTVYTDTICFKKTSGATYQAGFYLLFFGGTLVIYAVRLNTDTGVATAVSAGGFTAPLAFSVADEGGYWRLFISGNSNNNTTARLAVYPNLTAGGGAFAGSQVIWGADLRPANIGANVPAYQRIADANTYDTSGFPLYLRFDGIDDSMYTPANLNLSGTDKVSVFAGVRKLSDAAAAALAELSANFGSNNGSFAVFAPASPPGANYYFALQGTAFGRYTPTTYTAPTSDVLTGIYDIGGATLPDEIKPRINAVLNQTNSSGGPVGGGNFGTYPLYIGSRNNASFFLNGHLHSLIIAGSAVSAGNISATEQWVAGKVGLVIP